MTVHMRATTKTYSLFVIIAAAALSTGGCGPADRGGDAAVPLLAIRNARIPMDGVLSGGQPTEDQFETAARAGFRTVINLRTDREEGSAWEREIVERLGMRYVQIPVAGANGLTRDNINDSDQALREALETGPTLLHCGSGNRVGAVLALREAWIKGSAPDEALAYGRATGLTSLEPTTRELLGLPAKPE